MAIRNFMKKYLIVGVGILVISLIINQQRLKNKEEILGEKLINEPIKIGAIYDLSGVSADIGKAFLEGTEIALGEINSQGGINGRNIEIIYEDGKDLAAKPSVDAAQKLINVNKVNAILDISYSGLGAMQKLAEDSQTPILDTIDASREIASFGDWVFGVGIHTEGVGRQVAEFAKNELQITSAAILVGKDEYLLASTNSFMEAFENLGGKIVIREEFVIGTTDFRTQLVKIKNSRAEAIFFSHLGEGGYGIKQAAELGFKGYFLGTDPMSIADVSKVAGNALNDKTFFALWRNFDELTDRQKQFAEKYKQKYGKEPGDYMFYNVLGYDGLMVLAEAMQNSDLTGKGIKDALYKIQSFDGLSGPITIDETGINRDPKSAIVMYKEGKIVRYK